MMLQLSRSDSKVLIFNNSRNTLAILMSKDTANAMKKYFTLIEKHQLNAVDKICTLNKIAQHLAKRKLNYDKLLCDNCDCHLFI